MDAYDALKIANKDQLVDKNFGERFDSIINKIKEKSQLGALSMQYEFIWPQDIRLVEMLQSLGYDVVDEKNLGTFTLKSRSSIGVIAWHRGDQNAALRKLLKEN